MHPGDRREVAIAVKPPLNAAPGTYDTTIRCISVTNAAVQAGMVVRTTVLPGNDLQDETELAEQKSQQLAPPPPDSATIWPWFLAGAILVAAVAVVIWRRRA